MAGADLLWENSTTDWLVADADLVWENSIAGWLADKPNEHNDMFKIIQNMGGKEIFVSFLILFMYFPYQKNGFAPFQK